MSAAAEPVLSDDLKRLLERKRSLEDELQAVERRIFKLEESYIAETMSVGNVIRGWDGYLSTKNAGMYKSISRRAHVKDNDRMFTQSSATGFPSNDRTEGDDYDGEAHGGRLQRSRKKRMNEADWAQDLDDSEEE